MRIAYTPQPHEYHPIIYWIDIDENILRVGTNNDDGYRFVLVDESIDWFINYLRGKSCFMIPQIVQAFIANFSDFQATKAELVRL